MSSGCLTMDTMDPELKAAMEAKDCLSDHVENTSSDAVIPPDEEKKLIRKMDMHIMPVLVALYLMSFLDRVNIGMWLMESQVLYSLAYQWFR